MKEQKEKEKLIPIIVRIPKYKKDMLENGVRIDIWTHFMRECIINYVH